MENTVFLDLEKKSESMNLFNIYYWKQYGKSEGLEVDFVIYKNSVKFLINITYASSYDEINKRELKSIIKASEELKCNRNIIITWDYYENKDNIEFIPLWYWLINDYKIL